MQLELKPFVHNEEDLNEICKKFQQLLRCQDWIVEVKLVHQKDLGDDAQGRCAPCITLMRALIELPIPETFEPSHVTKECNNKLTLIHELLHLVYTALQPSPNDQDLINLMFENATDRVAEAIYFLTKDDHRYMCDRELELERAKNEHAKQQMKEMAEDSTPEIPLDVLPFASQYIRDTGAERDYKDWVNKKNAGALDKLKKASEAQASKRGEIEN